jgi:hypothetical protein
MFETTPPIKGLGPHRRNRIDPLPDILHEEIGSKFSLRLLLWVVEVFEGLASTEKAIDFPYTSLHEDIFTSDNLGALNIHRAWSLF